MILVLFASAKMPPSAMTFTPAERDYIRRELDAFFSTFPAVSEAFSSELGAADYKLGNRSCRRPPKAF
jgi:hypothetical protein